MRRRPGPAAPRTGYNDGADGRDGDAVAVRFTLAGRAVRSDAIADGRGECRRDRNRHAGSLAPAAGNGYRDRVLGTDRDTFDRRGAG
jgi:hypothetical protein